MYAHSCLESIAFGGDCSGPTVITPLTTECQVHRAGGSAPLKPVSPFQVKLRGPTPTHGTQEIHAQRGLLPGPTLPPSHSSEVDKVTGRMTKGQLFAQVRVEQRREQRCPRA